MKDELELVFPTEEYIEKIIEFKDEFIQNGEDIIYGSGGLDKEENVKEWLKNVKDDLTRKSYNKEIGRFPAALYLAIRKNDKKLIGIIQIRLKLNEYLLNYGGHIGDSVRPSERNKGYSTKMISLALNEARKLGIGNVLIVCYKENTASAKTIIKNGGILENEINDESNIYQRYWITLKKKYADARNKDDILKRSFKNIRIDKDNFHGNISLLTIKEVKKEWRIDVEQRCILANNYNWLGFYPDGKNYCITAMLDDKDNIVEWHFDMARQLGEEKGVPYEDDLYLDVVLVPDGRINVLDEDELEDAYNRKEVSKKDYDMAYETANKIIKEAKGEGYLKRLNDFTKEYLKIIKDV